MDTAVVVIFVALSFVIILAGIRWIYTIGSFLLHLAWKILKGIRTILFFPIGLILKAFKV
ncbi:MAG: hypothetical protein Q4E54_05995 [Lachnospiraceae bacterium]|nr:hypothetical protein [Lachnospiraceae bacterium]